MALTLSEAQARSNNVLEAGIYDVLINVGEVLPMISFMEFSGTTFDYRQLSTRPSVSWRDPGDVWTESSPTTAGQSASLKILGGDIDLDHFLTKTLSNINDHRAINLKEKLTAMAYEINDTIVYGDDSANAKQFDGIHEFLASNTGQRILTGADGTGDAPTVSRLRQMLRLLKLRDPDVLLMARVTRDGLTAYFENAMNMAMIPMEQFGRKVPSFDNVPIFGTDFVNDAEGLTGAGAFSAKTTGDSALIAGLSFGMDAVHGLQNGGLTITVIDELETLDASRVRVKWYLNAFVVKNTLAVAGIVGTDSDGTWSD